MKKYIVATFAALAAVGALVVSSSAWADTVVNVKLWNDGPDMAIKLDKDSVPTGKVTFKGTNISTDDTVHEMLVIKVESKLPNLPYDGDTGMIPEDKIHSLGEISEVEPGKKGELTLNMKPGIYLLFCNRPGHFAAHMEKLFFVKAP